MKGTVSAKIEGLFHGEVTLKKADVWLLGLVCVLLGVVIGFLKAPFTHGVTISCGNNNGNYNYAAKEETEEEPAEE